MKPNTIYNEDVLDRLFKTHSSSADIVFTDPPYNVGKRYDGYDDAMNDQVYLDWMRHIFWACGHIAKRGIIVYVSGNLAGKFFRLLPDAHMIVVHKRAAGVTKNKYQQQYHVILSTVDPLIKCVDLWDDIRLPGEGYYFREPRYDNPGMTSLKLIEKVLYHFTKEDDIVLDPFMGCGATAEACVNMNRKYIGIEQSKKYCEIAEERIHKAYLNNATLLTVNS